MINIETNDPVITNEGFRSSILFNGKEYISAHTYVSRDSARRQARKIVQAACKGKGKKGGGKGK